MRIAEWTRVTKAFSVYGVLAGYRDAGPGQALALASRCPSSSTEVMPKLRIHLGLSVSPDYCTVVHHNCVGTRIGFIHGVMNPSHFGDAMEVFGHPQVVCSHLHLGTWDARK